MKSHLSAEVHSCPVCASPSVNAASSWRARLLSGMAGLCAGLMVVSAQAAFQAVDTFDDLNLGTINGQNGWSISGTSGEVVLDPADGSNQALEVSTESGTLEKAMTIARNTTRMLFLRLRFEEHGSYSFGVSFASNPAEFVDFSAELGMAAATTGDPNNDFRVANGSSTGIYDVLDTLTPGTWYNVWVLINNTDESYEVWLNSDPDGDAQASDQQDNDQDETSFGFRTAAGTDLQNLFMKTGGGDSPPNGRFYIDDIYLEDADGRNLSNPTGDSSDTASVVASSLPSSRSVQVGNLASAFATMINTSSTAANDCSIEPQTSVSADFSYQTTDASNVPVGTPNTPADIAAGESQNFVFGFLPTSPFSPTEVLITYDCTNSAPAPVTVGLNTLLLSASASPIPDIVALAATLTGDGILNLPGPNGSNAFAVSAVNVGSADTITATPRPSVVLPLAMSICQTDATGACLSAAGSSATGTVEADATPTYSVFVTATGTVPFDPANNRIVVEFTDSGGVVRGSTSVAVTTQ